MRIENILAIADKPKDKQIALHRALMLSKDFSAHLEVAGFTYHPMYDQRDVFETHQRRAIKKELMRQRTEALQQCLACRH